MVPPGPPGQDPPAPPGATENQDPAAAAANAESEAAADLVRFRNFKRTCNTSLASNIDEKRRIVALFLKTPNIA